MTTPPAADAAPTAQPSPVSNPPGEKEQIMEATQDPGEADVAEDMWVPVPAWFVEELRKDLATMLRTPEVMEFIRKGR